MFSRRTEWKLVANRFSRVIEELRASGRAILDLTASNPTQVGIKPDSTAILHALANESALEYEPQPKGLPAARNAVAEYYEERGESIDFESMLFTTGTSEAYSYVFRLLANPDDQILVPKPSYPLFDFLAELEDIKLIPYPLIYDHGWQIDFHGLERAINEKVRALVLVNPNNPTGSYVSRDERAALNQLCADRGLALIVDEVFLDYDHLGSRPLSFAVNEQALTFTLSGLSKVCALPQMKLAWIAVSGPQAEVQQALERLEVIADTYLSVAAPVQWAARTFLGQRKTIQAAIMERVKMNLARLDRELAKQPSCVRLAVQGGWYAVVRVPATDSDEDLVIQLLRDSCVLVHPGHFYDFPQDGFLVISLITPEEEFRTGIERLMAFFESDAGLGRKNL